MLIHRRMRIRVCQPNSLDSAALELASWLRGLIMIPGYCYFRTFVTSADANTPAPGRGGLPAGGLTQRVNAAADMPLICSFQCLDACSWPAPGELAELAGRADLAHVAERPDVLARVGVLLEALRGAARGTTPRGQVAACPDPLRDLGAPR